MSLIPPIETLEERYKDIMENESVKSLSSWIETNSDDEFNEEEYLSKGLNSIDKFKQKMDEVLSII
ncbi:MAG: hypothetical protein HQK64_01515 [Desulfamplus sp.]|nr:hypothetical protein [Desulfamplus sp.]MBF0388914.1 hypothetical protein [Desulfamplus sp.]